MCHTHGANSCLFWSSFLARWQENSTSPLKQWNTDRKLYPSTCQPQPKSLSSPPSAMNRCPLHVPPWSCSPEPLLQPPLQAIHAMWSGQLATSANPGFVEIKDKSPISGKSSCPKSPSPVKLFKSTVILHQIESSLTIGSTSETIHRHIFSPFLTGNRACVTFTVTWSSGGRLISHLNKQTVFLPRYRQMGWKGKLTWLWPSQIPAAAWEAPKTCKPVNTNTGIPNAAQDDGSESLELQVSFCTCFFWVFFYEMTIVSSPVDLSGAPLMVWTGGFIAQPMVRQRGPKEPPLLNLSTSLQSAAFPQEVPTCLCGDREIILGFICGGFEKANSKLCETTLGDSNLQQMSQLFNVQLTREPSEIINAYMCLQDK